MRNPDEQSVVGEPVGVQTLTPGVETASFERKANAVFGQLQRVVAEMLRASGRSVRTPTEVEQAFGVDYKLAWQVHRIATARNPLEAAEHIPARVSMRRLLKAAARRKVDRETLAAVLEAFDEFEKMVEAEAGDRAELGAMVAAFVPEARVKRDLANRQAAFKAWSQMKGVAMEAQVGTFFMHPNEDGSAVSCVNFSNYLGLRRLRAGAYIGFATISATGAGATVRTLDGHVPDEHHSILLRQYCTVPESGFTVGKNGPRTEYMVAGDNVGLRSAVDLAMAEHRVGVMKRYRTADGKRMTGLVNMPDIPMKRMTTDIFVHRDVYPGSNPQIGLYDFVPRGMVQGGLNDPSREKDRIPLKETCEPIVGGMRGASLQHVPKYLEMIECVCGKLGWDADVFRGYRIDVSYPVYGGQYMFGFALPDPPAGGV